MCKLLFQNVCHHINTVYSPLTDLEKLPIAKNLKPNLQYPVIKEAFMPLSILLSLVYEQHGV